MRSRLPILTGVLELAILLFYFGRLTFGQSCSIPEQLALVGGTIYMSPTENPIRGGRVLVRDGKIAAVGLGRL